MENRNMNIDGSEVPEDAVDWFLKCFADSQGENQPPQKEVFTNSRVPNFNNIIWD